jgi:hypothetical protein
MNKRDLDRLSLRGTISRAAAATGWPMQASKNPSVSGALSRWRLVYQRLVTVRLAGDGISRLRPRRILGFEFQAK